jgi:hypothetical protein
MMNNIDKLNISLGLIKQAGRLASMLKIRRKLPIFSEDKKFLEHTGWDPSGVENVSFYDPLTKSILLRQPRSKKHELIHAYQDQLPVLKNTLAGNLNKLPFLGKRLGMAALELEARVGERKDKNFLQALQKMTYNSPHYINKLEGDKQQQGFKLLKFIGDKFPSLKSEGQI